MSAYDLPTSLIIGEVGFPIRYQWRAVLDILIACADPDLDDYAKSECVFRILYPDYKKIKPEQKAEALQKACEFIDCGQRESGNSKPKMIDWAQDAPIIILEVNKVAGREIRLDPDIHWWTFFGWFMGIGDGLFASILHIRSKKSKRKKLENWEQEFYNENRHLIDFDRPDAEKIRAEKDNILKFL